MSAPIPLLLTVAACADWFTTLRPIQIVARIFEIEPDQLQQSFSELVQPFTMRGQLELAIQSPHDRPDLVGLKTHLARLEHQLTHLSLQFERAEHRVRFLANKGDKCGYDEMFEAEKYSNKLQQQFVRLLKDIHKAQIQL